MHAAVKCAPPLRPKCERPLLLLLLLLLLLFGWAVSARGLKGEEEEEEGRPLLHCHGYVGVYTENPSKKKLEFPTILLLVVQKDKKKKSVHHSLCPGFGRVQNSWSEN